MQPIRVLALVTVVVIALLGRPAPALSGVGPRVDNHGLNAIPGFAYSAPYEDLKLKKK